jgi:hypothetical protein
MDCQTGSHTFTVLVVMFSSLIGFWMLVTRAYIISPRNSTIPYFFPIVHLFTRSHVCCTIPQIMTITMSTNSTSIGTQSYHVSATKQTINASGVSEARACREQQIVREMKLAICSPPSGLLAQNQKVMVVWNLLRCRD